MEPLQPAMEVESQQPAAEAGPQQPVAEVEPQPAALATAATTAAAVATPPTSPVTAAAGGPEAVVVEITDDDDIPPPGWDQWASAPASAPEAAAGVLVAQSGAGTTLGHVVDGAGPSSPRTGPSARLEQG
jgi:hypothetical protein